METPTATKIQNFSLCWQVISDRGAWIFPYPQTGWAMTMRSVKKHVLSDVFASFFRRFWYDFITVEIWHKFLIFRQFHGRNGLQSVVNVAVSFTSGKAPLPRAKPASINVTASFSFMGFVWNVILSFGDEEYWQEGKETARERCAALDAINRWMPPDARLVDLTGPTFKQGCGTGISAHVYGGGFKHFDVEGFIATIKAQPWKDPANVQIFLKSDADDRFFSPPLFDGRRKRQRTQPPPRERRPQ